VFTGCGWGKVQEFVAYGGMSNVCEPCHLLYVLMGLSLKKMCQMQGNDTDLQL